MAQRWYIVQAHSGFEKKVAQSIKEQTVQKGLVSLIDDVVVPTEEVTEVRRGKKMQAERKFFPGYVLVKMELTDATWHMVKNTAKVTGFLGGGKGGRPVPITEKEAESIFAQVRDGVAPSRSTITFEIGEQVKITEGPFESFVGLIEGVEEEKQRVKVSVSIFGRATPVDLEYGQVEKVES
ncbi:MAG: transcription termination/antitermination protein NusG [Alphaproteobacteria bacterium]|nr:transcription termination/antitermination protein NusG [Alphaproteobacteria bacterium]